jgi:general secretion pathway protein I
MMAVNSHCRQRGFTLLETLVAFAILALVLAVVFQIFGHGSRSARLSHDYLQGTIVAQSVLAQSRVVEGMAASGEQAGYQWQWSKEQANYADPGSGNDVGERSMTAYDIAVTVSWQSGGKSRTISLNSVDLDVNK